VIVYADTERGQALPSDQMLDVLPRATRWAEARRVLELGPVRADAARTLHYTAFLPWEEAKAPRPGGPRLTSGVLGTSCLPRAPAAPGRRKPSPR
jgi:hypothetical protein